MAKLKAVGGPFLAIRAYCLSKGYPEPVPEHPVTPGRRWKFDAAWPAAMVAAEVHGSVYAGGHHTRGKGFEDDREKANAAVLGGWRLFEVSTGQLQAGDLWPILDAVFGGGGGRA